MMLPIDPTDRDRFLKEQKANGGYTADGQRDHTVIDVAKNPEYAGGIVPGPSPYNEGRGSLSDSQDPGAKVSRVVRAIARGFGLQEANPTLHDMKHIAIEMLEDVGGDESKIEVERARKRLKQSGFIR